MPSPATGAMLHNVSVNAREKTRCAIALGGLVKVKAGSGAWNYRMKYTIVRPNEEKITPIWIRRGLIELSTMSHGCTPLGAFPLIIAR